MAGSGRAETEARQPDGSAPCRSLEGARQHEREERGAGATGHCGGPVVGIGIRTQFRRHQAAAAPQQAAVEASRCYFCYDAPCIEACPTGIDIPSFIHKIGSDNIRGAALDILQANIFGGVCARVCPTEELCEEVCVRTAQEGKPVNIGLLQRYATDRFLESGEQPFERAEPTGKRIAVIGAGPAGIGCAHGLARLGHEVTVYEARDKAGGLNEYGMAAYKVVDDFAQRELDFILAVGGITLELGRALGSDLSVAGLRSDHDAVFLATGQAGVKALEIEGEVLEGVRPAIDYIAELRQAGDLATLPVGRKVIVIGGDCITGLDLTVQAVEDGKIAARSIDRYLAG